MKTKIKNSVKSVLRPIQDIQGRGGNWVDGTVITPHGIVLVYCDDDNNSTSFKIVKNGLLHTEIHNKTYSNRYLITLAKYFAEGIDHLKQWGI